MKLIVTKIPGLKNKQLTRHKAKKLQVIIETNIAPATYPSSAPTQARRKNATPRGSSSLIGPPYRPTKAKV